MGKHTAIRLGKNIAAARKKSGMTQSEMAERVGIDTVSLSRIERGVVNPGLATLERIAAVLKEPLSNLFDGVSSNTTALANDIAAMLEPLHEDDRLFLLEQLRKWAARLSKKTPD